MDSIHPIDFIHTKQSLMLSTISQNGFPHASYAPFVLDEHRFLIRASLMAEHAKNLMERPMVSVMIIADESETDNIFARARLMLECHIKHLEKESEDWFHLQNKFFEKFDDETNQQISQFLDFQSFALTPLQGRLVMGLGKAFNVDSSLRVSSSHQGMGHQIKK